MEVTIQEAAKVLGVSVYTVRRRIRRRQVPAIIDAQGRYLVHLDEPDPVRTPAMFATPTLQGKVPDQAEPTPDPDLDRATDQHLESLEKENADLRARLTLAEFERDNLAERIDAWREEARAARVAMKELRHEFLSQPAGNLEKGFSELLGPSRKPDSEQRWGKKRRSGTFAAIILIFFVLLAATALMLRLVPNPVIH